MINKTFVLYPSPCSFGPMCFSRAYINFKNRDDIVNFRDQYDGYRFVDNRGNPVYLTFFFLQMGIKCTKSQVWFPCRYLLLNIFQLRGFYDILVFVKQDDATAKTKNCNQNFADVKDRSR